MADTTIGAQASPTPTVQLKLKDNGDGSFSFQHFENPTQRTALISALTAATPAGENHIGEVGGKTVVSSATPVVSTTAYTAGDVIGTKLTFANLGRITGGTGMIQMVSVYSKTAQAFACDLVLFHSDPTASTFTDNVAIALNATDFDKVVGVVHINDWTSLGTPSFAQATQLAMSYKVATGSTDLFGILVARSSPTLASTSDLKIVVKGLLD